MALFLVDGIKEKILKKKGEYCGNIKFKIEKGSSRRVISHRKKSKKH